MLHVVCSYTSFSRFERLNVVRYLVIGAHCDPNVKNMMDGLLFTLPTSEYLMMWC